MAAGALLAVLSIVYVSWKNGISPMPSSVQARQAVSAEINQLSEYGVMVEAGSGWGNLAFHIAKACKSWQISGVENSLIPLAVSKLVVRLKQFVNLKFVRGDIYTYPYDHVDAVVCYLYPGAMKKLSPIWRAQLVPGARIISVCFALPDWEPERVITCGDLYRTKVYVYVQD